MKQLIITTLITMIIVLGIDHSIYAQRPIMENNLHVKGILKEASSIFTKPNKSSGTLSASEKFSFVFLFKTEGGKKSKNGFYRVGKSPDNPDGWIPTSIIQLWNHRVCLNFTELVGRKPALVFRDYNDINSSRNYNTLKEKSISMEPTGAKKAKTYDMLLPVLEEKRIGDSNKRKSKAYKVAYLTGSGSKTGTTSSTRRGKTKLEIMFLIDATGSMHTAIADAKKVVRELTDHARKMDNTEVWFGVMSYRDRRDRYIYKKHLALTQNHRAVSPALGKIKAADGGNPAEAMYEGVQAAINTTRWSKKSNMPSLRVVVLIGDARAHEAGEDGTVIDRSDLVDRASKKRVRFITIKIISGSRDNDLKHKAQLKALVDGIDAGDKGFFSEVSVSKESGFNRAYMNTLKKSVENEMERMMQLEKVRSGKITLDDVVPSNRAIFLKNMPASGLPSKGLHFNTGWISGQSPRGDAQTESYVFMTRSELDLYLVYMQTAVAMGRSKTTDKAIAHTMADRVSAMTGTSYKADANLKDHLQKKLAIPETKSGLLDFSLADVSTWSGNRKKEMVNGIRTKRKALDDFSDDPSNWRKPAGSGFEYTFVPLSYFP